MKTACSTMNRRFADGAIRSPGDDIVDTKGVSWRILFCAGIFFLSLILCICFESFSIMGACLCGAAFVLVIARNESDKTFAHLLVLAIASTMVVLLLYFGYINKYGEPYYLGGSDDLNFEAWGRLAASREVYMPFQITDIDSLRSTMSQGYIAFMSVIVCISDFFGGYNTLVPRMLNVFFLLALALKVRRYAREEVPGLGNTAALILLYAFTLFPNTQYVTAHVFRDTLSALLLFWFYTELRNILIERRVSLGTIATLVIVGWAAFWIRTSNVYFLLGFFVILIMVSTRNKRARILVSISALLFMAIFIFMAGGVGSIAEYFTRYNDLMTDISGGLSQSVFSAPLLPWGLFMRIGYGMIYPFPGGIMGLLTSLTDIDILANAALSMGTILQIFLLPYAFKGLKPLDSVSWSAIMVFFVIILTTFGFRHLLMLYPFFAIMVIRGFSKTSAVDRQSLFSKTLLLVIGVSTAYLLLKGASIV